MGRPLGQHFLADPGILDRIVAAVEPEAHDVVIEIGPGRGTLTRRLAGRVSRVIAVEKDRRLAEVVRQDLVQRATSTVQRNDRGIAGEPIVVVQGDALELDWEDLVSKHTLRVAPCTLDGFKAIGNIPYYITTPLIDKALAAPACRLVVFLMQREVAERLAAAPGGKTYGALSAGVQAVARVERLFTVRAGAFRPPPKVDSALVRLSPLAQPLVSAAEQPRWRAFLAGLFAQRRKQLGRSVRALSGRAKEDVEALLERLDIAPAARPEALAPVELVSLFRALNR